MKFHSMQSSTERYELGSSSDGLVYIAPYVEMHKGLHLLNTYFALGILRYTYVHTLEICTYLTVSFRDRKLFRILLKV